MESLKGKNVLVLGATGGIGSKTTRLLAGSGASLFLTGRNIEKLSVLAAELNLPASQWCASDITQPAQVEALRDKFFAHTGQLDILLNAAGTGILKSMDEMSYENFQQVINNNLVGPFLVMKAFLPKFKEQKRGLIIHIPGVLGKAPMTGAAAYSASKYGLVGMMQSIREEVKRTEIRISNIFLGGADTPFWDNIDLRVQREKMVTPDDAARTIWYLCQQPSSAVVSEMVIQPFNHQVL